MLRWTMLNFFVLKALVGAPIRTILASEVLTKSISVSRTFRKKYGPVILLISFYIL